VTLIPIPPVRSAYSIRQRPGKSPADTADRTVQFETAFRVYD
jgi:hypothetical protein